MKYFLYLPYYLQWLFAIVLLICLGFIYFKLVISIFNNPILIWLVIFISPLFYFFTTPFFTLIGKYEYYSDVMFGYKSKNQIEIHLGTNFDYLFTVFPNWIKGQSVRSQIKKSFIQGNLHLIQKIRNSEIESHSYISTTSHLVNHKTFQIFNVSPIKMNFIEKFEYYIYTIDLLWMYLFSCGLKKINRIFRVHKVQIRAINHCQNEAIFKNAMEELQTKNNTEFTISQYQNV